MDVTDILDPLNTAQREAVTAEPGNMLVLAGAGSGKTRVLVHRIAWYIASGQASAYNILAVTFTNKAAAEMRARIESLLQRPSGGMWVGTFHGIAHRLLRTHWQEARLPQAFQVLDSEDQYRTIRRVLKALALDETLCPPKEAQWFINARKEEGQRSGDLSSNGYTGYDQLLRVYQAYEETCERSGLVDFTELLLRAHELWLTREDLLQQYRQRLPFVLVDEFQDTNTLQYAWLRLLVDNSGCLFAVGDDDQSIYSWRGAKVENMQRFQRDFPATKLFRLEQNYRSTATILKAANALITNNTERLGKELWTDGQSGEPITLFTAFNDLDEARFCVGRIQQWRSSGRRLDECAILYRTSAQSRVLEDALRQADLPYRVHGGFKFYERAEIKDALAYVRLLINRHDDAAFERVVNTPTRGIGQRAVDAVRELARRDSLSLWAAAQTLASNGELGPRGGLALRSFLELIDVMDQQTANLELPELLNTAINSSTLIDFYRKDKTDKGADRIENLEELVSAARQFVPEDDGTTDPLTAFLTHAALEGGEGQADAFDDSVQMMTLHSAKGLEFSLVILVGMEEGLFPHQRSTEDPAQLQEERRLCYVGITRAKEKLVLTHAEARRLHGSDYYPQASRFLREIPKELLAATRIGVSPLPGRRGPLPGVQESDTRGLRLGARVIHAKFGEGVVLNLEGQGAHTRVQVNFTAVGAKWLVAAFAGLQDLG